MRIFWNEFKKLFNWKLLVLLVIFSGLFYYMFLSFDLLTCYPNGHPAAESLEIGKEMLKKYGPTMDKTEQKEFETVDFRAIRQAANRKLAAIPAFREAGVTTVDQYVALDDKKEEASANRLFDALDRTVPNQPSRPDAYYLWQQARETVSSFQDASAAAQDRIGTAPAGAPRERIRTLERRAVAGGIPTIPQWPVLSSWTDLTEMLAVLLLFTVAVLLSPFLVRERRSGVCGLAYTCRKGRPLFSVQLGASLAAAALAEAVQLAVFAVLYRTGPHRGDLLFLGCDVSYVNGTWWDLTFGRYLFWSCAILFLLAFGFALLSFAVSKLCKNYIAVLAAQIPLIFLAGKLCIHMMDGLFTVYRSPYFEPLVCAACMLLPLALCLFLNHRERTADIFS